MAEWLSRWKEGRKGRQYEWINEWIDRQIKGWMDSRIDLLAMMTEKIFMKKMRIKLNY